MLSNLNPFLAAETAYRSERARLEITASRRSRQYWPGRRNRSRRA